MAKPSIPIGVVCSQSGPYQLMGGEMLKSALMAIDDVNDSDEFDFRFDAHICDPKGVLSGYHAACENLIRDVGVSHIVGCYTSASRKQVLPIVEQTERLLWYPARYEGFECSDNVIYVGASPNHNVIPLVKYMLGNLSRDVLCVGSNYVWTWETNRVTRELVTAAGGQVLAERLLEIGEHDVAHIIREIVARRPAVIFNTLIGLSSYRFIRAFHDAVKADNLPTQMMSCSLCEPELEIVGYEAAANCITSSSYFESIALPQNRVFVARWKARYGADAHPSVDGQSTYIAVILLARAIKRAGSVDVAAVRTAAANHRYESPQGSVWVDPENNHCVLTPRLARSNSAGQFDILWEADAPQRPDPYLSRLDLMTYDEATLSEKSVSKSSHLRVIK